MEQPTTNRTQDVFLSICQSFHMLPSKFLCCNQPDERSQPDNPPQRVRTGPCCAWLCSPGERVRRPSDPPCVLSTSERNAGGCCSSPSGGEDRWKSSVFPWPLPQTGWEISGVGASLQWGAIQDPWSHAASPRQLPEPGGRITSPDEPPCLSQEVFRSGTMLGYPKCVQTQCPARKNTISPFCWD